MALREDTQPPLPKDGRKRKTPIRGIVLMVVAVAAAVGAALLLTRYMDARVAAARIPTSKVVVARVDIPVASPIKLEWLAPVDWPASARPEGAVSDPAVVVGKVAAAAISRGEAVLPSKLVTAGGARSGLATILGEGTRAVAVRVDDVIGVAGFIHPGDRVDVIVTMKPKDEAPFMSKIVLQNVRVLAVGKDLEIRGKDAKEAKPVTVATLMVTSEESERLALSADKGKILLALRGLGDEELAETRGITPPVLMLTAPPEPPKPAVAAAKPAARPRPAVTARQQVVPEAPTQRQVVEILRGDLFEKRSFEAQEKRP
jgi:pilus assembly protein CpaB